MGGILGAYSDQHPEPQGRQVGEERAASYAHKMSKAPKPNIGKYSGPVKTNEIGFSQFLRKPAEGAGKALRWLWLNLGDGQDTVHRIWKQPQRRGT